MANKNQINPNTIIIIVALIIFAIIIIPKLNLGAGFQFGSIVDPISLFDNEPDPECIFKVDYEIVCLGRNVTGTINAKSPACYIGYNFNYGDWKFAGMINETSPGLYQESRAAPAIGHYEFAAICGAPADFCRTNNVEVDVVNCDEPDNGVTYTCGWVGEQCGGTCPDDFPLCEEIDWISGDVTCACLDNNYLPHPDWKPDGDYYDPYEPVDNCDALCGSEFNGGRPVSSFSECTEDESPVAVGDEICCCLNYEEEVIETIGSYCVSLGFDRHWDTNIPSNCPQAAINYCEPLGYDNEYFYDYEKEWCCYKCIERVEPDCNIECSDVGYPYGGWYSGGVSCGDFEHYLSDSQCCCDTIYTFCESLCFARGYDDSIPFVETGWNCAAWASSYCGSFSSMDDGTCCCWECA